MVHGVVWRRAALAGLGAILLLVAPARAQTAADLSDLRGELKAAQAAAPAATDGRALDALRAHAFAVQSDADALSARFTAQTAAADARLAQLGAPAPNDPPALRDARRRLDAQRADADGLSKEARLLSVQAGQEADAAADRRRETFNATLLQRAASPLSPDFWTDIGDNLPRDLHRLRAIWMQAWSAATHAREPRAGLILGAAALLALVLVWPVRAGLELLGRRRASEEAPTTSLRRSAYAAWMVAVDTATPGLAVLGLRAGAAWAGLLSPGAGRLADGLVIAVWWGAAVTALGRTLLSVERPSWRLPPVSDRTAARVRPYPWAVALVTGAGVLLERVNQTAGASLPATVAGDSLLALLYSGVAAACLVALGRGRAPLEAAADARTAARSSAWSLVALAVAGATLLSVSAAVAGYSALAIAVARQVFWIAVLAAVAFVLLELADDACQAAFRPDGRFGRALLSVFGLHLSTLEQMAVLSSALLRLVVALGVLSLILAPFGQNGSALVGRFSGLGHGFHIGTVLVSPAALLGALVTLVVGVALVRAFQRWLDTKYLPVTGWDAGVSNSVSTAVGYLGVIAVVLWAFAAAGLGLQRIALIASALSVGIGFGLQQIVQNFVSGLILLVERPVKVGDWVTVGGVDGNVRNIRVRATEIETFDRFTVLVPNSELVTKTLTNKTLHGTLGRITIELAIGDPTKAEPARDAILAACAAVEGVLEEPAPALYIDSVADGAVRLKAFAYVSGPRQALSARSAVYFEALRRLKAAGIALAGASQTLVLQPGDAMGALFDDRRETAKVVAEPDASVDAET